MTEYETAPPKGTHYRDELGRFRRPRYRPIDPLLIAMDFALKSGDVFAAELLFPAKKKERIVCDNRADFESLTRELIRSADDPPSGLDSFLPKNRRRSTETATVYAGEGSVK